MIDVLCIVKIMQKMHPYKYDQGVTRPEILKEIVCYPFVFDADFDYSYRVYAAVRAGILVPVGKRGHRNITVFRVAKDFDADQAAKKHGVVLPELRRVDLMEKGISGLIYHFIPPASTAHSNYYMGGQ